MKALNGVPIHEPISVHPFLINHISVYPTCEVTKHEYELFSIAVFCVASQLIKSGFNFTKSGVTCFFVGSDQLTLDISEDVGTLGIQLSTIIYPVHRWREKQLNDLQIITCYLEELCHFFFDTHDESLVKDHVVDCIQNVYSDLDFHDLYPGMCIG